MSRITSFKQAENGLDANGLKLIAITAMFIDHLSWWLFPLKSIEGELIHILGRIVAPVMCYFVAEGYFHTRNLKKYILRLILFALISHFPYVYYFEHPWYETTGIMWGLAMGLIGLAANQSEELKDWQKWLILLLCCLLCGFGNWSCTPVIWIVLFGHFRGNFRKQMIAFLIFGWLFFSLPMCIIRGWQYAYQFGIILAIPLLALYNGKKGKKSLFIKWGFYIFYPLHLIILYIFRFIIFK
ncbi:TraX protein [Mobilisporobacter senegalensis]|uniref:TraX protein n=1 Tax=Mobilisporobacter senegalensis TaxID=1329262 RepID=A0A3N1Y006_9FIRM|nr:TraX family protein [Mobilisporobacter senegalensis]ROR31858.1 TraX protein [Mobilisporobacter senegalensis]